MPRSQGAPGEDWGQAPGRRGLLGHLRTGAGLWTPEARFPYGHPATCCSTWPAETPPSLCGFQLLSVRQRVAGLMGECL